MGSEMCIRDSAKPAPLPVQPPQSEPDQVTVLSAQSVPQPGTLPPASQPGAASEPPPPGKQSPFQSPGPPHPATLPAVVILDQSTVTETEKTEENPRESPAEAEAGPVDPFKYINPPNQTVTQSVAGFTNTLSFCTAQSHQPVSAVEDMTEESDDFLNSILQGE